jgi:hypothetical protein
LRTGEKRKGGPNMAAGGRMRRTEREGERGGGEKVVGRRLISSKDISRQFLHGLSRKKIMRDTGEHFSI